jgi:hypothetical protein
MNDAVSLAPQYPDGEDPKYLLPQMGHLSVSEPVTYRSLFILDTVDEYFKAAGIPLNETAEEKTARQAEESTRAELRGPIDPFDEDKLAREDKSKPAVGLLTVHRQSWVQSGLALGNLMQSICLAPGEVTRVAVVDWRRQEAGVSAASTEQRENVSSLSAQDRSVNEVQNAVASEAQAGTSTMRSTSASIQGSASLNTLFATGNVSAAANTTTALAAQFSVGNRSLGVSSSNAISARTAEASQALRSRRQTIVREVSQKESEMMSSRILANYNRRHSLNVEYFEVLQKYSVETKLAAWERCLFVPLKPLDFTVQTVEKHRTDLLAIARQLGSTELSTAISNMLIALPDLQAQQKKELGALEEQRRALRAALPLLFNAVAAQSVINGPAPDTMKASFIMMRSEAIDFINGLNAKGMLSFNIPSDFNFTTGNIENFDNAIRNAIALCNAEYSVKLVAYAIPLPEILNSARILLSQMIWMRMDSYRIYRLLAPYTVGGKAISSLVDPQPIGYFGNYLAFRWGFARGDDAARQKFEQFYVKPDDKMDAAAKVEIAVPTSGVFAEAVLGRGEAAEELDDRFGNWKDNQPPILPPEISALTTRDRAKDLSLSTADFASALAALRATALTDASHVGSILSGVTKGDSFRNMGGLEQTLALAKKSATLAQEGAGEAGDQNVKLQAKFLDTFVEVFNSDIGKAAVAEAMLPGAGAMLLTGGMKPPGGAKNEDKAKAGDDQK